MVSRFFQSFSGAMSGATEIYICQPGQPIKEGRVEYGTMETRDEALSDAERRCGSDPSIAKVAYYAVSESGDFRCICTYDNPKAGKAPSVRTLGDGAMKSGPRRPVESKPSLIRQLRAVFEED